MAALADRGQVNEVNEAIAQYQQAVEINPDFAEAHNSLGIVFAGLGKIDEAIAHFGRALEIKPDFAEAHNSLGNLLAGRGQLDEAIAHYRKALEIDPGNVDAHNNLGSGAGPPWAGRRGHRPLPHGPGNQARLPGGPRQSGQPR